MSKKKENEKKDITAFINLFCKQNDHSPSEVKIVSLDKQEQPDCLLNFLGTKIGLEVTQLIREPIKQDESEQKNLIVDLNQSLAITESAFIRPGTITNDKSVAIWNRLHENNLLENGVVNRRFNIDQQLIDTLLNEETKAIRAHALSILQIDQSTSYWASIHFNKDQPFKKNQINDLTIRIRSIVSTYLSEIDEKNIILTRVPGKLYELDNDNIVMIEKNLPIQLEEMFIIKNSDSNFSPTAIWYTNHTPQCGWVPNTRKTIEAIKCILNKKDKKLKNYAGAKTYWLLITADDIELSGTFFIEPSVIQRETFKTHFEKLFILMNHHTLYELKTTPHMMTLI